MMAQGLVDRVFTTEDEFKSAITEEWNKIEYDRIQSLIDSVPARCQAVIDARGCTTRF
jgi:hypothetical protein